MAERAVTDIVGPDVPDQNRLRRRRPVRTLDEYLEFLRQARAVHGSVRRRRRPTLGGEFRL